MNAMPPREISPASFRAAAGSPQPLTVLRRETAVEIGTGAGPSTALPVRRREDGVHLTLPARPEPGAETAVAAAIEALTSGDRDAPRLFLDGGDAGLVAGLVSSGTAVPEGDRLRAAPELLWQRPAFWLAGERPAFPELHRTSEGRRHPLRAPKPAGFVYSRFIPWLGQTIAFRVLDPDRDAALYSRWMNDPRVEPVWEDAGDLGKHRRDLAARTADPHVLPLIGCFEGTPFGYFEVYWAKESRLGPHYEADDYDRGWHVAIGEEAFRGRAFITAWLPSLMHFLFLDDVRTRRIVGEPRSSHAQQIRNLDRAGFAKVKHFDFPHKRALLVMLLRERFFSDRLFAPETAAERSA